MTATDYAEIIGADLARLGQTPPPRGLPARALEALLATLGSLTRAEQEAAAVALRCAWRRAQKGGAPC
jgi:hypothetical protein